MFVFRLLNFWVYTCTTPSHDKSNSDETGASDGLMARAGVLFRTGRIRPRTKDRCRGWSRPLPPGLLAAAARPPGGCRDVSSRH